MSAKKKSGTKKRAKRNPLTRTPTRHLRVPVSFIAQARKLAKGAGVSMSDYLRVVTLPAIKRIEK